MKGLDLAEQYFHAHGHAMIKDQFGDQAHLIAAGLVGPGSECFGFDDRYSRDHDWGPAFCLWVDDAVLDQYGEPLQSAYGKLPRIFMGFGPRQSSPGEEHRTGVSGIRQFYQIYTGLDHPPDSNAKWLRIPQQALATCTNGRVFYDPAGQFSAWRSKLTEYYPEDVRIYKIAAACVTAAQSGQYNFSRSLNRGEWFALRHGEIQFCNDMIALAFLLNRGYAPFFKWRHRAVRQLPLLGEQIYTGIATLMDMHDHTQKRSVIDQLARNLIEELQRQNLTGSKSAFLLDHVPSITDRIRDPSLRQRFAMFS